jgi:hypothetical protein
MPFMLPKPSLEETPLPADFMPTNQHSFNKHYRLLNYQSFLYRLGIREQVWQSPPAQNMLC